MISHTLHLLDLFVAGAIGMTGEPGTSSGTSATVGSLGATEDLGRMSSPVAFPIDVRESSLGDLGDQNRAPGNNRDNVEDSYRARGDIFGMLEGSTDMRRHPA